MASAAYEAFRRKVWDGTATATDYRNELARRMRDLRAVSVANDPKRGYRKKMQEIRKEGRGYTRMFGIGKVPKPPRA